MPKTAEEARQEFEGSWIMKVCLMTCLRFRKLGLVPDDTDFLMTDPEMGYVYRAQARRGNLLCSVMGGPTPIQTFWWSFEIYDASPTKQGLQRVIDAVHPERTGLSTDGGVRVHLSFTDYGDLQLWDVFWADSEEGHLMVSEALSRDGTENIFGANPIERCDPASQIVFETIDDFLLWFARLPPG